MDGQLSILNIGGHPKDAIFYAGGTLAVHVERGDRVCTLATTHGLSHHGKGIHDFARSGKKPDLGALIEERRLELIAAANELGVTDVRFLGHDDWIDLPNEKLASDIADVIGEVRPDIIITHWPSDSVPAHANATRMTLLAMNAAAGIQIDKPYGPHGVKQVFFHTVHGLMNVLENDRVHTPTTVIDITSVIQKKHNALNQLKTQYYGGDIPLARKVNEAMDGGVGMFHGVAYAEPFVAYQPQVYKSLPLSDYGLELGQRSEPEVYEYLTQMLIDTK
jgi:LmbE family N-acetylglucosaminyl deacetylase